MAPHSQPNALGLKSVLGTERLTAAQIDTVLSTAKSFQKLPPGAPIDTPMHGKTVVLFFFEPSTRTSLSFELAAKRLGAHTLQIAKDMSSMGKGETLLDTARTIEAMHPDVLFLRHPSAGSPHTLDQHLQIPIINAGDGFHEHPTQALLDCLTIQEFKGSLQGLKVLLVGDIAHSRVARSNIYALKTLGADVSVCAPPTLVPPHAERLGVQVFWDLKQAVEHQDVIILLRIQFERFEAGQIPSRSEYSRFYGMSKKVLERCKKDVLIMHPGPVNRGLELSAEVADGPHSVILNQVTNGVSVRMALLHLLMGGKPPGVMV